jgi:two-component system invasion response regulator UvrY
MVPERPAVAVGVVSGNGLMRTGVCHLLDGQPSLTVVRTAPDLPSLGTGGPSPDVVVVADAVEDYGHLEPVLRAHVPSGTRTVLMTSPGLLVPPWALIHGPLHAVVGFDADGDHLARVVHTVAQGDVHIGAAFLAPMREGTPTRADPLSGGDLTPREQETLRAIVQGLTHAQIARRFGLTEATVNTYVKRIRNKLHAGNKAELTRIAIERGHVSSPALTLLRDGRGTGRHSA